MSILPAFMMMSEKTHFNWDNHTVPGGPEASQSTQEGLMPEGFLPSPDDVVIGRGKKIIARNVRFLAIIESELKEYSSAESKALKSSILVRVLSFVRDVRGGLFVKQDAQSGRWYTVEDGLARTTIAQNFRDALHTMYRSSKRFKRCRRRQRKSAVEDESKPESITKNDAASDKATSEGSKTFGPQAVTLLSTIECTKKAAKPPKKANRASSKKPKSTDPANKRARSKQAMPVLASPTLVASNGVASATSKPGMFDLEACLAACLNNNENERCSLPSLDELISQHKNDDLFSPALFSVFDEEISRLPTVLAVRMPAPLANTVVSPFDDYNGMECLSNDVYGDDALSLLDALHASDSSAAFTLGA